MHNRQPMVDSQAQIEKRIWFHCSACNKRGWLYRKAAKRNLKRVGNVSEWDVYRCRVNTQYYHIGHKKGVKQREL